MPLNYLSNQDQNIYAAGDIGRSWADAAIQARRIGLQQAIEMQRLGMERERLGMEGQEQQQRMDFARQKESRESSRSAEDMRMAQMIRAAMQQYANARGAAVPLDMSRGPTIQAAQQLNQRSLANAAAMLMSQNPAVVGRSVEPLEVGDKDMIDQITGATVARGRMNPYQLEQIRQGEQGLNIDRQRAAAYAAEQGALRDLHVKQTEHPELFRRQDPMEELIDAIKNQGGDRQTQTNASTRIRVRTPDGKTGTMDSREPLPAGWTVIK